MCSMGWRFLSMLRDQPSPGARGFPLSEPDWLPALINAARAFLAIGAVELFWVATAWPNGASAIVFVAIAGSVAFAERRSCLRRISRIRPGHRRRRSLCGSRQIRDVARAANVPGLLRRLGSLLLTGRLCNGREPATNSDRRPHRHGVQLQPSPRAHQRDELRHRTILQFRACNRRRLRRRTAGILPVASVVAGPSSASPSRLDLP